MNVQLNFWFYTPGWLCLFLAEMARDISALLIIRGNIDGKHYCIRLR